MSRKETLREAGPAGLEGFLQYRRCREPGAKSTAMDQVGGLVAAPGGQRSSPRGWAQLSWARSVWGALFPDHDGVMSGPQELKG